MSTAARLADEVARVAYLLAVEGWPLLFTTEAALVGVGDGTWIGAGDREVVGGLSLPKAIELALDLGATAAGDSLSLTDGGAVFTIADHDERLAALLGNADPDDLDVTEQRLHPTDDPAPATTIVQGGATGALWGRQIGGEQIGPAGERRYWPALPHVTLPGLDHASLSADGESTLAPVAITDHASLVDGRRVALYVLAQALDGSWPSWSTQAAEALRWWGTLRSANSARGRSWSLRCDGPASWLSKSLNRNAPAVWRTARPVLTLTTETSGVGLRLSKRTAFTITENYLFQFLSPLTATGVVSLRAQINALLQTAKTVGVDSFALHPPFADCELTAGGTMRVRIDLDATATVGTVSLCLHRSIWGRIGFDVDVQRVAPGNAAELFDVAFMEVGADGFFGADPPGPGYVIGTFYTLQLGAPIADYSIAEASNNGSWRPYRPIYADGSEVLRHEPGQLVHLSGDDLYLEGQLGRPPSDSEIDAVATNAARWILFYGLFRTSITQEPIEYYQVARVSYRELDGEVYDPGGGSIVRVDYFEDPRLFGVDNRKLDRPWALPVVGDNVLQWQPLAALRYSAIGVADRLDVVLARLLLSTGTAAVSGFDDGDGVITLTPGDNDHADASGDLAVATDAEIADLGLAIPESLVDIRSFRAACDDLPGGVGGALARVVVAFAGIRQSSAVIGELCKARGLAITLAGGRYSLLHTYAPINGADAVAVVGGSARVSSSAVSPEGLLVDAVSRFEQPFDRVEVSYQVHPVDGAPLRKSESAALDRGARLRTGKTILRHTLGGAIARELYDFDEPAPPDALAAHRELWTRIAAEYHAAPHVVVRGVRVSRPVALKLWPGSVILFSSPWPPNGVGGYGFSAAPARVLAVRLDLESLTAEIDVLVQHGAATARAWGPIARVVDDAAVLADRYDAGSLTWKCYGNAFRRTDTASDVAAFAEPSGSSIGGAALVYGWQYNGHTWAQSFSFNVASVDTAAHTITATGAYTGTFRERKYTLLVLAPYDVQTAAWARDLLLVTCDPAGLFGGVPTKGWSLRP